MKKKYQEFLRRQKKIVAYIIDIFVNLVLILALVLIIRTYLISPFQVYGKSMCDTFNFFDGKCNQSFGEYIIVNKLGYQNFLGWQVGLPKRGDIIVFHPPNNDKDFFIKRVIGLPGETVKLVDGLVYLYNEEYPQGVQLKEEYLNERNAEKTLSMGGPDTFVIPDDQYLAFGDNRMASSDARSCFKDSISGERCGEGKTTPYLTLDHIDGKAMIILWPLNKIGLVSHPDYE